MPYNSPITDDDRNVAAGLDQVSRGLPYTEPGMDPYTAASSAMNMLPMMMSVQDLMNARGTSNKLARDIRSGIAADQNNRDDEALVSEFSAGMQGMNDPAQRSEYVNSFMSKNPDALTSKGFSEAQRALSDADDNKNKSLKNQAENDESNYKIRNKANLDRSRDAQLKAEEQEFHVRTLEARIKESAAESVFSANGGDIPDAKAYRAIGGLDVNQKQRDTLSGSLATFAGQPEIADVGAVIGSMQKGDSIRKSYQTIIRDTTVKTLIDDPYYVDAFNSGATSEEALRYALTNNKDYAEVRSKPDLQKKIKDGFQRYEKEIVRYDEARKAHSDNVRFFVGDDENSGALAKLSKAFADMKSSPGDVAKELEYKKLLGVVQQRSWTIGGNADKALADANTLVSESSAALKSSLEIRDQDTKEAAQITRNREANSRNNARDTTTAIAQGNADQASRDRGVMDGLRKEIIELSKKLPGLTDSALAAARAEIDSKQKLLNSYDKSLSPQTLPNFSDLNPPEASE